jgi:hypothetical protein
MKKLMLVVIAAALAGSVIALTDEERIVLRNLGKRERCVDRRPIVIGGTTNIVETWKRGEFTWTQTNAVRQIVGKTQTNTFEEKLAVYKAYKADAELTQDMRKKAKKTSKNLEKILKTLNQAMNKAQSEEEAELYRALIELLEGSAE